MENHKCILVKFREEDHEKLFEVLKRNEILDNENAEDVVYALYQITEHIEKIYSKCIPNMLNEVNSSKDKLKEIFNDIKFESNEIRQLIETSKLKGLKYWDDDED